MKIQILRLGMVLFTPIIICAGLGGSGAEKYADLQYSNSNYSYEETGSFAYDSCCKYDDAYLEKLRVNYNLEQLVADCGTEFEKVQAVTEWVSNIPVLP